MRMNLRDIVGQEPASPGGGDQIFGGWGGPARAGVFGGDAPPRSSRVGGHHRPPERLEEITEMIPPSLVHDDVWTTDTRGGAIHALRHARASSPTFVRAELWYLANLDNLEVIKLISQVIADFADGEISQAGALYNVDITLEEYLEKSHNKTARRKGRKDAAVFSGVSRHQGGHVRVRQAPAWRSVVDDILDFTQTGAARQAPGPRPRYREPHRAPSRCAGRMATSSRL